MSNYRRLKINAKTYFITVVTYQRKTIFSTDLASSILRDAINKTREILPFEIDAWVLLPDHMHAIWTLPDNDADFSKRWGMIKKEFSKSAKEKIKNTKTISKSRSVRRESNYWQRIFWNHMIRNEKDYRIYMDYLHYNPVKHGHVKQVKDWPYSSFHRYVKESIYPLNWGGETVSSEDGAFGE